MSNRTIILIILLSVVTGVLVYLAVTPKQPTTEEPITVAAPTPTPVAQTMLAFMPNPLTIASPSGSVDVQIDTGTNNVTAVQLEVEYDPKVVTNVTLKPGSFFQNPVELLSNIDTKNGKISYAIGILPSDNPQKGQGTVATLSFRTNLGVGQATQIKFLPKTLVTASGITSSVLKSSGAPLLILRQSPTPPQSGPTPPPQANPSAQ